MKKWTEDEKRFIIDNYALKTPLEISIELKCKKKQVIDKARNLGVSRKNQKLTEDQIDFLTKEYNNYSTRELADKLHTTHTNISAIGRKLGLKRDNSFKGRIYSIDHSYFYIPNINNSYWAGMLAADGGISKEKKCVSLGLKTKDRIVLERLRQELKCENPIRDTKLGMSIFSFSSLKIIEDLNNNFNIIPQKTFTLNPPNINNDACIISYMIGFLDGDGCLHFNKTRKSLACTFSGRYEMLSWIRDNISRLIPVIEPKISKTGNIFNMSWCGKQDVGKLLTMFYFHPTSFKLPRKVPYFYETYIKDVNNV